MWQYGTNEIPLSTLPVRPSGHPDYSRLIDPEPLRPLAAQLITPYIDPRGWTVAQASAIFDFVKRVVTYDYPKAAKCHTGIPMTVLRPSYTLELGRGICTDQAVLVSSLFAAAGFPCSLVLADTLRGPHLLTALHVGSVFQPWNVADAVRVARGWYDWTLRPWIFSDVGDPATFADTAAGGYLGDYPTQLTLGTIYESGYCAYWRRIIDTFPVRALEKVPTPPPGTSS